MMRARIPDQGMVIRRRWTGLILLLIVFAPVPSEGEKRTTRRANSMTNVVVEIDIFSGMPNPAWTLSEAQANEFLAKLGELPETKGKSRSGNLGYAGLIVRMEQGANKELHIQNGFVEIRGATGSSRFLLDPKRSLERWLLATGRASVDKTVLEVIDAALADG
jgi:hypothetical protein